MTTDLPCIREGAEVAITHRGFDADVTFAHIARLTPTTIVLDNGDRYRRGGDYAQIGVDKYKLPTRLVDPHSPDIANRVARALLLAVINDVGRVTTGAGATLRGMDAAAVRDVIDDLVDKLNAARKEIDRRAGL